MEVTFTRQVAEYPELRLGDRRTVLGFSTEAGYTIFFVMLDEQCRSGPMARVVPVPVGCCDISDGCLASAWSLDHHWIADESRSVMRVGPHGWVAEWGDWMARLAVGDEQTLADAWTHAQCPRVPDEA